MSRSANSIFERFLAMHESPLIVPSVHHTGTWFALEFLIRHGSVNSRVVELDMILEGGVTEVGPRDVVHFHFVGGQKIDSRGPVEVDWFLLGRVFDACRCLVPLRDPVRALVSRESRHPGYDHGFIVEAFLDLADLMGKWKMPATVAVDLCMDMPVPERQRILEDIEYDLDLGGDPDLVAEWARDWPVQNTWGDYELKRAYEHGDLGAIREAIKPHYNALVLHSARLRPMFKDAGYPDPFPWMNREAL